MKARIYKIVYKPTQKIIYIGSTTESLQMRWYKHKYNTQHLKHRLLYKYINQRGWHKFDIKLVRELDVKNNEELHRIEGYYIRKYNTFREDGANNQIAGRDRATWRKEQE